MSINVTIIGNVGADPELRFTAGGKAVVNFSVAETPRKRQGEEWVDGVTSWHSVQAWDSLAENIAESVTRGQAVVVVGRLEQEHYEKDGEKRSVWRVTATAAGPDLSRATATVRKPTRRDAADAAR